MADAYLVAQINLVSLKLERLRVQAQAPEGVCRSTLTPTVLHATGETYEEAVRGLREKWEQEPYTWVRPLVERVNGQDPDGVRILTVPRVWADRAGGYALLIERGSRTDVALFLHKDGRLQVRWVQPLAQINEIELHMLLPARLECLPQTDAAVLREWMEGLRESDVQVPADRGRMCRELAVLCGKPRWAEDFSAPTFLVRREDPDESGLPHDRSYRLSSAERGETISFHDHQPRQERYDWYAPGSESLWHIRVPDIYRARTLDDAFLRIYNTIKALRSRHAP